MRQIAYLATATLLSLAPVCVLAAPFQFARTIGGAPFSPAAHVTVVNYWATWCAPCRGEMPILDSFYRRHHAQGLEMLAVSIDQGVSVQKLRDVTGKFAFPVARIDDVKMPRKDIPVALPVTRIYDRSGKLVFATKGDGRTTIDTPTLERVVLPLLASR